MNRPIRGVAVTSMVIFAALMINLSYLYIGQQNYLNERPENRRVADARFAQDRGPIMVGNTAIAKSEKVKDRYKFQRSYTSGELYAQITGYYSYLYRTSGLEAETTQMIPVGVSTSSPRPGASAVSANTEPITPISPDEGGDEPTEVVELPGGRP